MRDEEDRGLGGCVGTRSRNKRRSKHTQDMHLVTTKRTYSVLEKKRQINLKPMSQNCRLSKFKSVRNVNLFNIGSFLPYLLVGMK